MMTIVCVCALIRQAATEATAKPRQTKREREIYKYV